MSNSDKRPKGLMFSKIWCSILIIILILFCILSVGIYFGIIWSNNGMGTPIEATVHIVNSNVSDSAHMDSWNIIAWPLAIVSSISICAITIIIFKILSMLRDIAETEQIDRHYNH